MTKRLSKVELNVTGVHNPDNTWGITASADLTIGLEEYPEYNLRKGIPITLTPTQETTIKNFVKNVVLPQAEAAK